MGSKKRNPLLLALPAMILIALGWGLFGCSKTKIPALNWVQIPGKSIAITDTEITQEQYFTLTRKSPSSFNGCAQCPVESVTWAEAADFCEKVGGRLPTEPEWEFTVKAATTTAYYCGDSRTCLGTIAWHYFNSGGNTHPVGQKTPNGFKLYDMSGNVAEWVDGKKETDPELKIAKGGSWYSDAPDDLTPPAFSAHKPGTKENGIGFRCARD